MKYLSLVLLLFPSQLSAQSKFEIDYFNWSYQTYGLEYKDGFLWSGGNFGLVRVDYETNEYEIIQKPFIESSGSSCLNIKVIKLQDKIIAYDYKDLFEVKGLEIKKIATVTPGIKELCDNGFGVLYALTYNGLVKKIHFQGNKLQVDSVVLPSSEHEYISIAARGSQLWLGTEDETNGVIAHRKNGVWNDIELLSAAGYGDVEDLEVDKDGYLWSILSYYLFGENDFRGFVHTISDNGVELVEASVVGPYTYYYNLLASDESMFLVTTTQLKKYVKRSLVNFNNDFIDPAWLLSSMSDVLQVNGEFFYVFPAAIVRQSNDQVETISLDRTLRGLTAFSAPIFSDDGSVWFVGDAGVFKYFNDKFQRLNLDVEYRILGGGTFDKQGNLWLVGNREDDGQYIDQLLVYDGKTTKIYDEVNSPLISQSKQVICDKDGLIWVVSNSEVQSFDGENWSTFNSTDYKYQGSIYGIAPLPNGHVWLQCTNGIAEFDGHEWKKIPPSFFGFKDEISGSENVYFQSQLSQMVWNENWVAVELWSPENSRRKRVSHKACIYNGEEIICYDSIFSSTNNPNDKRVALRQIDDNGTLWFFMDEGIESFDGADWQLYENLNATLLPQATSFAMSPSDNLWITSSCNLAKVTLHDDNNLSNDEEKLYFSVYPNPISVGDDILISKKDDPDSFRLNVYSNQGKLLSSHEPDGLFCFSTKGLNAGMYFFQILNNGNTEVHKVLILSAQ